MEQPGYGIFETKEAIPGKKKYRCVPLLCSAVRDFNEDYYGFSPIEVDTVVARRFRSMICVLTVSPLKV